MTKEDGREAIILVDSRGRTLGIGDKTACHRGAGILHMAFLVIIFNDKGELLLARRSKHKALWPGYWDGTIASHYHPAEDRMARVRDRVFEELGIRCERVDRLFNFLYQAAYREVGSEYELCDVYVAQGIDAGRIAPDGKEISECRLLSLKDLSKEAPLHHQDWTPWFRIALETYTRTSPPE